jgi:hypothetical protein
MVRVFQPLRPGTTGHDASSRGPAQLLPGVLPRPGAALPRRSSRRLLPVASRAPPGRIQGGAAGNHPAFGDPPGAPPRGPGPQTLPRRKPGHGPAAESLGVHRTGSASQPARTRSSAPGIIQTPSERASASGGPALSPADLHSAQGGCLKSAPQAGQRPPSSSPRRVLSSAHAPRHFTNPADP